MGPHPALRRLHLICGDPHRSQFNLALVLGATALALKAVQFDPRVLQRLQALPLRAPGESWVSVLTRLNRLGGPGEPPRVDPAVVLVQRVYLEAARSYADSLSERPAWIAAILAAWGRTLTAFEESDLDWLGGRLDAFIKRDYFDALLEAEG